LHWWRQERDVAQSMARARVRDRLTGPQGVEHVQSLVHERRMFGRVGGLPERGVLRFRWNSQSYAEYRPTV